MKNSGRYAGHIVAAGLVLIAAASAGGQGDPAVIERIIIEGKHNNQVWQHLEHLSYEIGTRLTGSSRLEQANRWTLSQFQEWGLSNCHLHEWGQINVRFDRGPSSAKLMNGDQVISEFEFTTSAWTPGTDGPVRGRIIKEPRTLDELEAVNDNLAGAWVLTQGRQRGPRRGVVPAGSTPEVLEEIAAALREAGIAGFIIANRDELVRTGAGRRWGELQNASLEDLSNQDVSVYVRRSDYDAVNSRLADGEDIEVEINLDNQLIAGPFPLYNTIAEIPGTEWPEQVVIVSGHLDSWDGPGAMGSQDNGTGTSVTLEAARLLMAAGAKPKRTIRFILWTGEEQGLLGSRAYIAGLSDEEKANISVCLVDDGGTNYEGGLRGIETQGDMLRAAVAPLNEAFPDLPVEVNATGDRMPRGGGSDHDSFNAVGIPGFFWMEKGSGGREGKDYRFIHHTQHDTPRYAVPEYLIQSSTCAAVTAYNLACADTLLPRQQPRDEEAPEDQPRRPRGGGGGGEFTAVETAASGEWDARFMLGDDPASNRTFTISIEVADNGNVRGFTQSEMGRAEIVSGTFDKESGNLVFKVSHPNYGEIDYRAKVDEAGKMTGSMTTAGGFSADLTAEKKTQAGDDGG